MKTMQSTSGAYANEEWSADRIKELTMSKIHNNATTADDYAPRHFAKRFAIAAVAVVLIFALATTALAVSGVIDLSTVIGSIFRNKEAAPYIQSGDGITMRLNDGEVSIKPIAAFYEPARSGMYLELEITDPIANRLSDYLLFVDTNSGNLGSEINTGPVDVRFVDSNTVIAGMLITPVNIGETAVRFDMIVSGIERFDELQLTQFNIGEHICISKPLVIPGIEFVEITEITLYNGKLTIAHRRSDAVAHGWGSASLGLMNQDGEIIWSNSGAIDVSTPGQQDFYEIGDTDPNDLTIVWMGTRAINTIFGSWEFTVTGENIINPRSLSGDFEGSSVEVTLGATIVEINIFADYLSNEFPYDYHADNAVTLLLKDGTTIHTRVEGIMCDSTVASFAYTMGFTNPADVVSVTFYGTVICE